jgi:pimeloyl-[acyl-carrier protein] methyl ester esterase
MTGLAGSLPLVVVGGWGVDARMLQVAVNEWPRPVYFQSLDDDLLASSLSVSEVAKSLISQYPQPAVWLGWSQGAQIVMTAANLPGTPVEKVVTLAGFPRFVAGDGWPAGMAVEMFEAFRTGLAADPSRTWRRFQQLLIRGGPGNQVAQARKALRPWVASGPVATGSNLERGLDWLAREDQRDLWQHSGRPALHLLAEADALIRPWSSDLTVPEFATVKVVSGMTHWPTGPHALECGRALNEFCHAERAP